MKHIKLVLSLIEYIFYLIVVVGFVIVGIYILIKKDDTVFGWVSVIFFGSMLPIFIYQLISYKSQILHSIEPPKTKFEAFSVLLLCVGFVTISVYFLNEGENSTVAIISILFFGLGAIVMVFELAKSNKKKLYYGYVNESGSVFIGKTTNSDGEIIEEWVSANDLDSAAEVLTEVTGIEVRGNSGDKPQYSGTRSILITRDHLTFGNSIEQLHLIRKKLAPGYIAFVGAESYGIPGREEGTEIVVAPGNNQLDILWAAGTDDYFIKQLEIWDSKYGIDILQAQWSFIHLRFLSLPTDLKFFADEIREFCPDSFEESGSKLEKDLEKNREIFLSWD